MGRPSGGPVRPRLPAVLVLGLLLGGCASSSELARQRRELTTRVLAVPYQVAFAATLTVLQDNGFVLEEVDQRSGLVRAAKVEEITASSAGRALGALFGGGGESRLDDGHSYGVSCVLTPVGEDRTELRAMIIREPPTPPEVPGAVKLALRLKGVDLADEEEGHPENYYHRPAYDWFFESVQLEARRALGLQGAPGASSPEDS
ncbi:MAG: hypothetical protein AMXMBFR53_41610 [Gemmatimonadota bacterium]